LAGFAHETYDARSACVAAVDTNLSTEQLFEELVSGYRGLGAPVLFTCCQQELWWWSFTTQRTVFQEKVSADKVPNFFREHCEEFAPERIHRAKNLGQLYPNQQLHFVDAGLMQPLEEEMGERLSKLMHRVLNLLRGGFTEKQLDKKENQRWVFRAGFWLLCAKILQDKSVKNFKRLTINDIDGVIHTVATHYGARDQVTIENQKQRRVLGNAANEIDQFSSLQNLTTEAFGYMYENVLVDNDLRSALGIHATPSYLVDYIVWQLFDWIRLIPQEKRVVLEPACGHAPFLTGAMRVLRELFDGDIKEFHKYAKRQLRGIEVDPFAREIARLSLTLADVPNPNGWKIVEKDIYCGNELVQQAKKAMILLSNPPFENFSKDDKQRYNNSNLQTQNKAAEVLARTLPYMPTGSVFGVILPQGFLDNKNLAGLRKYVLDNFEIRTICNLPDNVFMKAGHPATVLLAKKIKSKRAISYLKVPKTNLEDFKRSYKTEETSISKETLYQAKNYSFKIVELKEIWDYCKGYPEFQEYATIGRGIEYKDFDKSVKKEKFSGAVKGYASFEKHTKDKRTKKVDINITELPGFFWMSLKEEDIQNPRYGAKCGIPQIITNYIRTGRGIWRIKGLLDLDGFPVTNKLISIRPIPQKDFSLSLHVIWGLVNSPFTNAYMFCHCRRQNLEGVLRRMPTPFGRQDLSRLENLVKSYLSLFEDQSHFTLVDESQLNEKKKQSLLAIDAEVLRLYDLPPRLEKQLLDFFSGYLRKGVDFKFDPYYPKGFGSYIPLHMFISEEFQNSTVENVSKWVEQNRSPEVIKAFDNAVRVFEGD